MTTPEVSATPEAAVSPSAVPSPSEAPLSVATPAPLGLVKSAIQLNPGATTAIGLVNAVGPFGVRSSAPNVVTATVDPSTASLVLAAQSAGTATIEVGDGTGHVVTATVLVGPDAGVVPAHLDAVLTGRPTNDFVASQLQAAFARVASLQPGARLVLGDPTLPATLEPGVQVDLPLRVHLDGAGHSVDVDRVTDVHLSIRDMARVAPATLLYSDDPEKVAADGVLFRGPVSRASAARLYYYHLAATAGRTILIALEAPANGTVFVGGRGAGPNPAVLFVGQSATYRFLDDAQRHAGGVFSVGPAAPLLLFTSAAPLHTGDLVAGALDISVLTGGDVTLSVAAVSNPASIAETLAGEPLPSDGRFRRGVYSLANVSELALAAASDAPDAPPVPIGEKATALPNLVAGGRPLAGDYGVAHPVTLSLDNREAVPHAFYFYERPIGYPVTTTISFDGDAAPFRVPCVKTATNRYLIRSFTVPAHTVAHVTGSYMTDGGSTYPLAFGLTSTLPYAPPATMLGPDGCFEKRGSR